MRKFVFNFFLIYLILSSETIFANQGLELGRNQQACDVVFGRASTVEFSELPRSAQEHVTRYLPTTAVGIETITFGRYKEINFPGLQQNNRAILLPTMYGDQIIRPSRKIEATLLARSKVFDQNPIEVLVISGQKAGVEIPNNIFTEGEAFEVKFDDVKKAVDKFLAEHSESSLDHIEVIHSHPWYEAFSSEIFVTHPLSKEDITYVQQLSTELSVPVVIRAVVPNGYTYSAVFLDGKNITADYF